MAPFILRAVTLAGINCVYEPAPRRAEAWNRLARDLDTAKLDAMISTIGLADVPDAAREILAGRSVAGWSSTSTGKPGARQT